MLPDLTQAIRDADETAFAELVEPYRRELHAHCYRMLGSVHDADDALQEALLRAWRGLDGFQGRSSLRSWLYRIATNACLDAIARRPKRVLPIDAAPASDPDVGPRAPLAETVLIEPYADEQYERRESVELAFIAALQHLPASQRAALILCEVLGFSAREAAEMLATTPAAVNSALQRARAAVDERLPERSQQETMRSLGDDGLRAIVDGYVDAWERGDVDAVVAMLTEDAAIAMPPLASWYQGHDALAKFLAGWPLSGRWRWRRVRTWANGQPALATYCSDADKADFHA